MKHVNTADYPGHKGVKKGTNVALNYDYGDGPLFSSSRALNLSNKPTDNLTDLEIDRIRHDNHERLAKLKSIHSGYGLTSDTGVKYAPQDLSYSMNNKGRLE